MTDRPDSASEMTGSAQLDLPGMPTPLYPATPSRLLAWVDCPRRYRMTYLDRPKPAVGLPWAHTSVGIAVHQALADWYALPPRQRTAAAASERVLARWRPEGFRDGEQSARWAQIVAAETAAYVQTQDAAAEPWGVERTVATRTASLAFSGRVDRVDDRSGQPVVVDYKTSRRPLSDDAARTSLALALYALALGRMLRRRCAVVELHHVPSQHVLRYEYTPESMGRRVREAESIAGDLVKVDAQYRSGALHPDDETFAPRPGSRCSWCDFRAHCPPGREAAPSRATWAVLEPEKW
ncbi:MAG: RecB family exonuclease [Actinomycetota bacterium]